MARRAVAKDQFVAFIGMFEEIINAFLFQEAADEIEICFPVLNTVFPGGVAFSVDSPLEISMKIVAFENVFNNLRPSLVLVNLAIGGPGKKPQPGPDIGVIAGEAPVGRELFE